MGKQTTDERIDNLEKQEAELRKKRLRLQQIKRKKDEASKLSRAIAIGQTYMAVMSEDEQRAFIDKNCKDARQRALFGL